MSYFKGDLNYFDPLTNQVLQSLADEYHDGDISIFENTEFKLMDLLGETYTQVDYIDVIVTHVMLVIKESQRKATVAE